MAALKPPFLAVQASLTQGQTIRVYYRTEEGLEAEDGKRAADWWEFAEPAGQKGERLATVVVFGDTGRVVRVSRPILVGLHQRLSESAAGFHHVAPSAAVLGGWLDAHPRAAATGYWVGAALLGLGALASLLRAFSAQDEVALRVALAIILAGFAVALGYEALSLRRARKGALPEPTIARLVGRDFMRHPAASWVITIGVTILIGALAIHFTRLNGLRFWTLGVAIAAFLAGAIVGTDRWLRLLK